jgi:hypothetical protein
MSERKSFPLSWPDGWKRIPSAQRKHGQFNRKEREYSTNLQGQRSSWTRTKDLSTFDAVKRVTQELERMGVKDSNVHRRWERSRTSSIDEQRKLEKR